MATTNVALVDNIIVITGALTFYNAPVVCTKLFELLPKEQTIVVNLEKVTKCDSASIVVLLQIVRFATQHQQLVQFVDMPKTMQVLSELYDLHSFFNLKNSTS